MTVRPTEIPADSAIAPLVEGDPQLAKLLLTPQEVARVLSMGRTVVYQLIMSKELFSVKIGGARRIPFFAVQAFVDRLIASGE